MSRHAPTVVLLPIVKETLERLKRSRILPQHLAERVRMILMSAEGDLCVNQAKQLEVDSQRVRRWRKRWAQRDVGLAKAVAQGAKGVELERFILDMLADSYRSGVKPKFSEEQVAAIIALGCEDPAKHNLPVSHWTPQELAAKAIEKGIVERISVRQVGRFLKGGTVTAAHVALLAQSKTGRPQTIQGPSAGRLCSVSRSPSP
jgi:hypothetical protein